MTTNRPDLTDQELWRSIAVARVGTPGAVSDIDLAAWLEGRLPEAEADRIDRAMAADPALRRTALELSDVLGQPLPASPQVDRLVVRAQALVGFEAERAAPSPWRAIMASLFPSGWRAGPQGAVMATMALLIAVTGFMMGGGLGESYAQQRYDKNTPVDSLSELGDLFTDGI